MRGCCGTCLYWEGEPDGAGLGRGHCRRYPPMVPIMELPGLWGTSTNGGELLLEQPVTYEEEWCGEWTPVDGAHLGESPCGAGKGTRWDSR